MEKLIFQSSSSSAFPHLQEPAVMKCFLCVNTQITHSTAATYLHPVVIVEIILNFDSEYPQG